MAKAKSTKSIAKAKEFWTSGKKGSLSAWSQAKVWALTTVSEEYDLGLTEPMWCADSLLALTDGPVA